MKKITYIIIMVSILLSFLMGGLLGMTFTQKKINELANEGIQMIEDFYIKNNITNQNQKFYFEDRVLYKKYIGNEDMQNSSLRNICHNSSLNTIGCSFSCVNYGTIPWIYECRSDVYIALNGSVAIPMYEIVYVYNKKADWITATRWYGLLPKNNQSEWILAPNITVGNPNII